MSNLHKLFIDIKKIHKYYIEKYKNGLCIKKDYNYKNKFLKIYKIKNSDINLKEIISKEEDLINYINNNKPNYNQEIFSIINIKFSEIFCQNYDLQKLILNNKNLLIINIKIYVFNNNEIKNISNLNINFDLENLLNFNLNFNHIYTFTNLLIKYNCLQSNKYLNYDELLLLLFKYRNSKNLL